MEAREWVVLAVLVYVIILGARLQEQLLRIELQIAMLEVTISTQ